MLRLMTALLVGFLLWAWLSRQGSQAMVITGVCEIDSECIKWKGENSCCASWNSRQGLGVCKPMGRRGQPCQLVNEMQGHPSDCKRSFWRCPCGPGLQCVYLKKEVPYGLCI
ncbi:prokineticin Bm8-f-like [Branchiostoma lanceolatum]|uniref:PROK1 protein n=1 Tax=Branchiostoma lanceolatum TaxID=7740 RepID=A0A8J9ZJT3_BRALA|nr:PROK1 [Branchiostoma lanceolatum]